MGKSKRKVSKSQNRRKASHNSKTRRKARTRTRARRKTKRKTKRNTKKRKTMRGGVEEMNYREREIYVSRYPFNNADIFPEGTTQEDINTQLSNDVYGAWLVKKIDDNTHLLAIKEGVGPDGKIENYTIKKTEKSMRVREPETDNQIVSKYMFTINDKPTNIEPTYYFNILQLINAIRWALIKKPKRGWSSPVSYETKVLISNKPY